MWKHAMALRPARDDDWHAMAGSQAPGNWFGLVEARPHFIEGMGCIYLARDGRWWIAFWRSAGVGKIKTAHAGARRLLADAKDRGLDVHAIADPAIPGAELWLERLRFIRTDETQGGLTVWKSGQ
jgi:hypothetical protein